jgi:hypothetical protein
VSNPLLSPHDAALVEATAQRVLELLAERDAPAGHLRLVSAGELAQVLGVNVDTVYRYAEELGVVRLPVRDSPRRTRKTDPRPRLRFDVDRALTAWSARQTSEESHPPDPPTGPAKSRRRRRGAPGSGATLLPIGGRNDGRSRKVRTQ